MIYNRAIQPQRSSIVELVGLAGAGKTTLSRTLSQHSESILLDDDLTLKNRKHILIFAKNALSLLRPILHQRQINRPFTWDEIKAMVYLNAWPPYLKRRATCGNTLLLDHGPVFKLAMLNAFGPKSLKDREFDKWWSDMFQQWASTLDMVIWLTAPDSILLERINARNQRHTIKGKPEEESLDFLMRYQRSYEQILTKLTACAGLRLLRFDTSRSSVEQILDELISHIKQGTLNASIHSY